VETTFSPINSAEFKLRIHNEVSDDGTLYCVILENCSKNDFYIVNIYLQTESDITCRKQHFWLFSDKEIALPDLIFPDHLLGSNYSAEFNENDFFKKFKCVMEIKVPEGNKFLIMPLFIFNLYLIHRAMILSSKNRQDPRSSKECFSVTFVKVKYN